MEGSVTLQNTYTAEQIVFEDKLKVRLENPNFTFEYSVPKGRRYNVSILDSEFETDKCELQGVGSGVISEDIVVSIVCDSKSLF